jgi:hypothetical protein
MPVSWNRSSSRARATVCRQHEKIIVADATILHAGYSGIKRVRAHAIRGRDRVVVDRHGMVARNELHVGILGRDNLTHAADTESSKRADKSVGET